ncbi:MAG: hypothetical protein R3E12_16230 [Candidatus Eisenbacteria bacterium]|uniref:T9SS type A sorting domain-containing protein n=1 Tax=Eiseniibacteriota bacterium TaxID=2212470 RepID=A0A956LYL0_UNCEI|nr:hypothetical protein [Candidatus Eisenbacteria bacterium]
MTDSYGTQTGDAWRIRIDGDGAVLEQQVYGNALPGGAADIAFDQDGSMVVVGAHTLDVFTDRDAWIHKVTPDGALDWAWSFDADPGLHSFFAVTPVSTGGYVAVGSTAVGTGPPIYAWVVRMDQDGDVVWQNRYHGGVAEFATCVVETPEDGGFAVAGWTTSSGAGSTDVWLLKLSSTGAIQWQKTYGGFDQEEATGLIQTADGGYAISAFSDTFPGSSHGPWVLRLDSSGNLLWHAVMGDEWGDFQDVVQCADGNLVATGRISGPSSNDLWMVKLRDSDGTVLWQKAYEGTQGDWGSRTIELGNGDLLVSGVWAWGFADEDLWIQRTSGTGDISSCGLVRETEVAARSPLITVAPAITLPSTPAPVPEAVAFVTNGSTLTIDEKCRATASSSDGDPIDLDYAMTVHPNPVREAATIAFSLTAPEGITIAVHDVRGRLVATIADGFFGAGHHEIQWDRPRTVPAGTYWISARSERGRAATRAVLLD